MVIAVRRWIQQVSDASSCRGLTVCALGQITTSPNIVHSSSKPSHTMPASLIEGGFVSTLVDDLLLLSTFSTLDLGKENDALTLGEQVDMEERVSS